MCLNVCVKCSLSLCGRPTVSRRVYPLNPIVSTMSVSPSHLAIELPNHVGSISLGCSFLNGTTWNQVLTSKRNAMYLSFWKNLHRVGRVHRSHQPVGHAHAGVVAVPDRVIVLHVLEAGRREGQFLRSLLQRGVSVGRRHVRHILVIPDAAEIRLAIRQPRRRTRRGRPVTPRGDARAAGGRLRGGRGDSLNQDGGERCDDENRA